MNDTRYKNLYDALTSQIDYGNFIETYGKDFVTFENTNFDLLQTIYGGFLLTLIMDTYFIKQSNNTVKCELIPEAVRKLVSMIATYNGSGYSIGNLMYKDEYTVLEKLRNKLAHGDFIIKDGEIIIGEKGVVGSIKVKDFIAFIESFEASHEINALNNPYTHIFNTVIDKSKIKLITNEKDMYSVCKYIYKIEITDSPIFPQSRNAKYCEMREYMYRFITDKLTSGFTPEQIKEMLKKKERLLKDVGMHIDYKITRFTDLAYYEEIKDKYLTEKEAYQLLHETDQINLLNSLSYRIGKGKYQNLDIRKGIALNIVLLEEIKEHLGYKLGTIIQESDIRRLFIYHLDDIVISSYLVGFNAAYEYGLEKGLTQKGNYNLVSIFQGKSLDFSKLELDKLDDPNMAIEHTFTKYLTDVDNYEVKVLKDADEAIKRAKGKLEQYKNCKNQEEQKIVTLKKEIEEAEELKQEIIEEILELKEFSKNFDLAKYTRNINIITHIRNAIAHGHVYINSHSTNIPDTEIIFRDYLNGQIVYEKKMLIKDFVTIFHNFNIGEVYEFITNNISDKTLIDEDHYENVILRSILREIRELSEIENSIQLVKTVL